MHKKHYLLILVFLISINSFCKGQKLNTYKNGSKLYDITVYGTYSWTLYIDTYQVSKSIERGGIVLHKGNYDIFLRKLLEAKQKFQEWTKVSNSNNINDFRKKIPLSRFYGMGFYYLNGRYVKFDIVPQYYFQVNKINNTIVTRLIVETEAIRDEHLDENKMRIVFNSQKEIDSFIEKISIKNIEKIFEKPPKTEELFK